MTALDTPLLMLDELTVQRGEIPLCEGVSLNLSAGSICHLVGANGTGKTTLLMQLAGLLPVLTGEVVYQGTVTLPTQPLYVSHQLGIHPNLTVAQNLNFLLNLYGITPSTADIDDALAWVG
ncbi:MAG: ABC transporter ATP-binding protein, partial [Psychrobacter sp.]